jgi:4-diphosphocytidyl-2-C-methyl-D-erythritol kinase
MTSFFSPAKINLYLQVIRKRPDSYHDLSSLFQTINLGDTLHFEWPLHGEDHFTCTDPSLPLDSSNLVVKAVKLFRQKTDWRAPVTIHLEKRIPMQSGLGGGSSNAATTLWALNQRAGLLVSDDELQSWSAEMGSDIPFFFSQGTALCQGRGDLVLPLRKMENNEALFIVKPPFGLSTPAVFQHLKLEASVRKSGLSIEWHNDLEAPAFELQPILLEIKLKLLAAGFTHVMMTGSGSAIVCSGEVKEWPELPVGTEVFSVKYLNRMDSGWYTQ